MATTIINSRVTLNGEAWQMNCSMPGNVLVDAATTISFVSAGDDMYLDIEDSAAGLDGFSPGDQIEVTGATNAANNFFWQVFSKTSASKITVRIRHNQPQADMTQNRDGVTESAGAAVTISKLYTNMKPTMGSFTMTGDNPETVSVDAVQHRQDGHVVYIFVQGKFITPRIWAEEVLFSAAEDDAWVFGNGIGNSAITDHEVTNRSMRKDAAVPYLHTNCKTYDEDDEAPYWVGSALDPLDDADLLEWVDPSLESYSTGDPVTSLTKQVTTGTWAAYTATTSQLATFLEDAFGPGKHGVASQVSSPGTWRQAFNPGVTFANKTLIVVAQVPDDTQLTGATRVGSPTISRDIGAPVGDTSCCGWTRNAGPSVSIISCDGSGNVIAWRNYYRSATTITASNTVRLGFHATPNSNSRATNYGKMIVINRAIDAATGDRFVRSLLAEYGSTWRPTYVVDPAAGNNANVGSAVSPKATMVGAIGACSIRSSPRIILKPTARYNEGIPLESSNSTRQTFKWDIGMHPHYPVIIHAEASLSGEPQVILDAPAVTVPLSTGSSDNFVLLGIQHRVSKKIPTSSPLRVVGDEAFDAAVTSSYNFISGIFGGVATFNTPITTSYTGLYNCQCVGSSMMNLTGENGVANHLELNLDLIDCSSVHHRSSGHILTHWADGCFSIYYKDPLFPTGGFEPIDDLEAATIFARSIYDQFNGPGCRMIDGCFVGYDGSGIQWRSGVCAYKYGVVDSSVGASARLSHFIYGMVFEAGARDGSAQQINWGILSSYSYLTKMRDILILPSTQGTQIEAFKIVNTETAQNDNGTVGSAPALQWDPLDVDSYVVDIENCTLAGRDAWFLDVANGRTVSLKKCLVKDGIGILETPEAEGTISGFDISIEDVAYRGLTGSFLSVDSVSKTQAEAASIVTLNRVNEESSLDFFDDTRSFTQYAKDYLADTDARVEDLMYAMVEDRCLGLRTLELQYDYIYNWVRDGFVPSGYDSSDYGGNDLGILFDASSATAPTVTTPTSTSITATTATLGGDVEDDGGASITERGIVISLTSDNADPEIDGIDVTKLTTSGTTGVFTVNATGLTADSNYTFRAYATNSGGTAYTNAATFVTLATPAAYVEASHTAVEATTGFPFKIDMSNLPGGFWTAIDTADMSKMRVYKGDGTTRLAVDHAYVPIDTDAKTGWISVLWPDAVAVDDVITIRIVPPLAAETTVAADDTYGSDNAYAASGPVLPFDGDLIDRSAAGIDGTAIGTPGYVTGRIGQAVNLNGSGDSVSLGTGNFNPTTGLTVMAWIKLDTIPGSGHSYPIAGRHNFVTNNRSWFYDCPYASATTFNIRAYPAEVLTPFDSTKAVTGATALVANTWYHVAFLFDAGSPAQVFVNGALDGTAAATNTTGLTEPAIITYIGTLASTPSEFVKDFDGAIDDIILDTTARDADWIAQEYAQTVDNAAFWGTWTAEPVPTPAATGSGGAFITARRVGLRALSRLRTFMSSASASTLTYLWWDDFRYSYRNNVTRLALATDSSAYAPLLTVTGLPSNVNLNAPLWSGDGTTTVSFTVDPLDPAEAYGKQLANGYLDTVSRVMGRPLDGSTPFCPYPNGWGMAVADGLSTADTSTDWITPRTNFEALSRHVDDLLPTTYLGDTIDPAHRGRTGFTQNGIDANYAWWLSFWASAKSYLDTAVGHDRTPLEIYDDCEFQGPNLNDLLRPISSGSSYRVFDVIKADARWSTELVNGVQTWEDFYDSLTSGEQAQLDNPANTSVFADALTTVAEKLNIFRNRCQAWAIDQSMGRAAREIWGSRLRFICEYAIYANGPGPGHIKDRTSAELADRVFEDRGLQVLPAGWSSSPTLYPLYGLRNSATVGNLTKYAAAGGYTSTGLAATDGPLFSVGRMKENVRRIRARNSITVPWATYNRYGGNTTGIIESDDLTTAQHLEVLASWRRNGVTRIIFWGNPALSEWATDFGPIVDNLLPELGNL